MNENEGTLRVTNVIADHIEIVEGAGGPKARIRGSRVRVLDITIWHEKLGMTPDEIVNDIPTITLADVHAALAYYWDHRDDIEQRIAEEKAFAEEMRLKNPSRVLARLSDRLNGRD